MGPECVDKHVEHSRTAIRATRYRNGQTFPPPFDRSRTLSTRRVESNQAKIRTRRDVTLIRARNRDPIDGDDNGDKRFLGIAARSSPIGIFPRRGHVRGYLEREREKREKILKIRVLWNFLQCNNNNRCYLAGGCSDFTLQ